MGIRVAVAGVTGWAGRAIADAILDDPRFELAGAVSRRAAREDVGAVLGREPLGMVVEATVAEALRSSAVDVLIDYTHPDAVLAHTLLALDQGVRVVIGTSGLGPNDFRQIRASAEARRLGVVAAGNFSLTAALAKHFALTAARYLPSWELVEFGQAEKPDAPSGTVRELAEALSEVAVPAVGVPIPDTLGVPETRGGTIGHTQVHVVRLPGYVLAFEAHFGQAHERLVIRHEAGADPGPYVAGTLTAAEQVMGLTGLVRGLDSLLFPSDQRGVGHAQ